MNHQKKKKFYGVARLVDSQNNFNEAKNDIPEVYIVKQNATPI